MSKENGGTKECPNTKKCVSIKIIHWAAKLFYPTFHQFVSTVNKNVRWQWGKTEALTFEEANNLLTYLLILIQIRSLLSPMMLLYMELEQFYSIVWTMGVSNQ